MNLDDIFTEAEDWIKSGVSSTGLDISKLGSSQSQVVEKSLEFIRRIQQSLLSNPSTHQKPVDDDLISIALPDMKTLNGLVRIIVLYGIHPCLDDGVGIPPNLRFKHGHVPSADMSPDTNKQKFLLHIMSSLVDILRKGTDTSDLILLGHFTSDFLSGSMQLAYGPGSPNDEVAFKYFDSKLDSYNLLSCYTTLLRRTAPAWFSQAVSRQLALIAIRSTGVRSIIEFTSGLREKGNVSPSDLDRAVRILKAAPRGMDLSVYGECLGSQLLNILSLDQSNALVSATAYIVNCIYEQKKQVIQNGLIKIINDIIVPQGQSDVSGDEEVEKALFALAALLSGSYAPELIAELCKNLLIPLWLLFCFMVESHRPAQIVKGIIVSFVNTTATAADTDHLTRSLLGTTDSFKGGVHGGVSILGGRRPPAEKAAFGSENLMDPLKRISQVESRVELFASLISEFTEERVSEIFTLILNRWIVADAAGLLTETDPFLTLADAKLLQLISQKDKLKLMKNPSEIIEVICTLVNQYALRLLDHEHKTESFSTIVDQQVTVEQDSDDEEEGDSDDEEDEDSEDSEKVSICLTLIETFLVEKEVLSTEDISKIKLLESSVDVLTKNGSANIKAQAATLMELFRMDNIGDDGSKDSGSSDSAKIYKRALSSLGDPLVPIRAHGLYLLRTLVDAKDLVLGSSPVRILKIFLDQLKDDDSFIYLNSVKGIEAIAESYGISGATPEDDILGSLLAFYSDNHTPIDPRLRCGEGIMKIIQRKAESMTHKDLGLLVETFISIVSRRGEIIDNIYQDNRLRMSAMSMLGLLCELNPHGLQDWLFDIVDCSLGILTFETSEEEAPLRRSAVVLTHSLVVGLEDLSRFPVSHVKTVKTRLEHARDNDSDPLVRNQADDTVQAILDISHNY